MSFRKLSVYLSPKEYERVSSEALLRGDSVSRCARSLIGECLSLRDELLPGNPKTVGDDAKQHILQVLLARTEERIARSIDVQADNTHGLNDVLNEIKIMLEKYVFLYLLHSPEVEEGRQDQMYEAARRRYSKWQGACEQHLSINQEQFEQKALGVVQEA